MREAVGEVWAKLQTTAQARLKKSLGSFPHGGTALTIQLHAWEELQRPSELKGGKHWTLFIIPLSSLSSAQSSLRRRCRPACHVST